MSFLALMLRLRNCFVCLLGLNCWLLTDDGYNHFKFGLRFVSIAVTAELPPVDL